MNKINLVDIARKLLEREKSMDEHCIPKPIRAIITWRNDTYIGHIQEIYPEYSAEIVALNKSSDPLPEGLVAAIKELDTGRLNLHSDNSLDLSGRQHLLRRLEDRLTIMTPNQIRYVTENPPQVYEI